MVRKIVDIVCNKSNTDYFWQHKLLKNLGLNWTRMQDKLKQELTEALCDALQGKYLTVENIAEYLVDSKLLEPSRLRQYLAVKEFFENYNEQTKTSLVHQLSAKYDISVRVMWQLVHKRRFSI